MLALLLQGKPTTPPVSADAPQAALSECRPSMAQSHSEPSLRSRGSQAKCHDIIMAGFSGAAAGSFVPFAPTVAKRVRTEFPRPQRPQKSSQNGVENESKSTNLTGRQKGGFVKGRFWRMCPHSGFRSGGTCERTLVPVLGPGEHPNVPSFRFRSGGTSAKTTLLENCPSVNPRYFSTFFDSVLDFLGPRGREAPGTRFGLFLPLWVRRVQMTPVAGKRFHKGRNQRRKCFVWARCD